MTFYEELSRYYDEIFPVDSTEMAFVAGRIAGKRRLLDIGCGTGNKTVFFSPGADAVFAFDSDAGMIARARADNARPNITYDVLDMRDMGRRFGDDGFDAAVCLGNTLVHLDGPAAIGAFLEDLGVLVSSGGVAVIQILHYNRILARNITALPELESEHVLFGRAYRREGEKLHFLTRITEKASGRSFDNDVLLYPLCTEELETLLLRAGFDAPVWYGNYQGVPLEPSSFAAIAVCAKRG